ncbi:MAG: hypothetical protein ACRD0K_09345 [Egibacteraceae bacterium]
MATRYILAPYVKAGIQHDKLYLGFGSIQREFIDSTQIRAALALACYWQEPHPSGDALLFLTRTVGLSESQAADLIAEFIAQRAVVVDGEIDTADRYHRHQLFYSMSGASPRDVQARLSERHALLLGCGELAMFCPPPLQPPEWAASRSLTTTLLSCRISHVSSCSRNAM